MIDEKDDEIFYEKVSLGVETAPIITEGSNFIYPFMISPIFLEIEENIKTAEYSLEKDIPLVVTPIKNKPANPSATVDIYDVGTLVRVVRTVKLPDGKFKVILQGISKVKIENRDLEKSPPIVEYSNFFLTDDEDVEKRETLFAIIHEKLQELKEFYPKLPIDLLEDELEDIDRFVDIVSSHLHLSLDDAYKLFKEEDFDEKLYLLIQSIFQAISRAEMKRDLQQRVQESIAKHNREHFLKQQLREIQKELGGEDNQRDDELEDYRNKLEAKKPFMSENSYKEINKQLKRLSRMHPESSEATTLQTYIEWVVEIPFGQEAKSKIDIKNVEAQLNSDHYSLKKPKDRILEHFAVKELIELRGNKKTETKGAILCFIGPPGVGKTSLANSIATAMKRKLVRIALGGLEDVNELRGHRRTYVGAMPGRITQGLIDAKEMNPVVVLDEIDKLGRSQRGDPTSAMLEILDPEQNSKFRDYYLNFDLDLSKITFIATANDLGMIPSPLRDRMEFIHLNSYTPQEKFQIAKKYLIPQEVKKHGLKLSEISISKKVLEDLINNYTREAGVRNLRRRIADIFRKGARILLENPEKSKVSVSTKNMSDFLDKTVFEIEKVDNVARIGIVTGLAWTSVGGDVLKTEIIKTNGKGTMKLTGKLGDVMKESAQISMSVVKTLFDKGYLQSEIEDVYKKFDLHLHIPDGATPKDGPSAGITMATAIASILSERKVRGDTAMTGEISLHGDVMPIGGLKEKIIAAHKAGISYVLIPKKNFERDLNDIPDEVKNSLEIKAVSKIEEILDFMLES